MISFKFLRIWESTSTLPTSWSSTDKAMVYLPSSFLSWATCILVHSFGKGKGTGHTSIMAASWCFSVSSPTRWSILTLRTRWLLLLLSHRRTEKCLYWSQETEKKILHWLLSFGIPSGNFGKSSPLKFHVVSKETRVPQPAEMCQGWNNEFSQKNFY